MEYIKEKKFYNKFLLLISLFLFILSVFTTSSFAYTTVSDYSLPYTDLFDNHISGKDDNGYYIIEGQNTVCDRYFVIESEGILYYFFVSDGYFDNGVTKYVFNDTSKYNYIYYEYYTDGSFKRQNSLRCSSSFNLWHYNFVYSTFDLTTENGTVFFQQAPQGITTTLVEEAMKAKILEQLKIMIVGFLKYLIAFVISVIAFWKGWQFLSMQLKKA